MGKRIPATNNAGQKPVLHRAGEKEILAGRGFVFSSKIILKFMPPEAFKSFVQSYFKNRMVGREYAPSPGSLKAFEQYRTGVIDFEGFKQRLKLRSKYTVQAKIGKLYEYEKQQNSRNSSKA